MRIEGDDFDICEFCKAILLPSMYEFCPGHDGLLKLSLFGRIGDTTLSREKSIHIMAECILRNYLATPSQLRALVIPTERLRWAVAYDAAIEWIVAAGGHAVCEQVTRIRLGLTSSQA